MISPVNKKIAAILGADIPPDDVVGTEIVQVEPHEIVGVNNPDLPPLHDIHRKQLQADKQLEEVISAALGYQRTLFETVDSVEPKYRSRYVEVANGTMGIALEAIKTKFKAQELRFKQRLSEAGFKMPAGSSDDAPGTVNNFFYGSREELINAMRIINEDPEKPE
jgi:hypothetical protein